MEKDENGPPVLALSVDVNENEEVVKSFADCRTENYILRVNKSRACSEIGQSDGAEKGNVVYSGVDNNVNAEKNALPNQCIRFSDGKMLDLISECLPGVKNSCGSKDRCDDAELNGFAESSGEVMAGSESGGGGTLGTSSCWDSVTTDGRDINGVSLDVISPMRTEMGHPPSDRRPDSRLNSGTVLQPAPPGPLARAAGQGSCAYTTGDNDDGVLSRSVGQRDLEQASGTPEWHGGLEDKIANGGMVVVKEEEESDLNLHSEHVGWPSDAGDRNFNDGFKSITSPAACTGGSRQLCSVQGEDLQYEARHATLNTEESGPGADGSPSRPLHPKGNGDGSETGSASEGQLSRRDVVIRRPLTLRTNPKATGSLSCDATPLSPDADSLFLQPSGQFDPGLMEAALSSRNTFEASRRQSAPDNIPDGLTVASDSSSDQVLKQKKYGISNIFGRSLFSRKPRESKPVAASAPGWKLFGRVPPRETPPKDSMTIQQETHPDSLTSVSTPNLLSAAEYEARTGKAPSVARSQHGRRKNLEFEPLSTTALILEDRPANLPAKTAEEAQRHRQEYDEMVAEAKKREMKEAQRKKKMMKERFKQEDSIANAMVIWNTEILPNWKSVRHTRRVRELWWQGLPPSVRGRVWSLAIGNELNITPELYEIFLSRAKEKWRSFSETGSENDAEDSGVSLADRESSLDLIKLDISRTFPCLFIFQKGGPYHDILHSLLGAYTCYRPDVGYVQGMSFIAAVLILNLEEADAFIAFANLLNKPCQMAFFRVDHDLMLKYFAAFEVFFEENLPRLFSHFKSCNLTPDLYLIDWIFTLYSKSLPLDVACRVWDVFCRDGEECLFRTALGVLRLYEDVLLGMDFIHIAQFLSRLPDDIAPDRLFSCIAAVQMLSGNRKWTQVFSALMKDNKEVEKNNSPALKS